MMPQWSIFQSDCDINENRRAERVNRYMKAKLTTTATLAPPLAAVGGVTKSRDYVIFLWAAKVFLAVLGGPLSDLYCVLGWSTLSWSGSRWPIRHMIEQLDIILDGMVSQNMGFILLQIGV